MEQLLRNFQICQSGSFVRVQLCLIFISESCRYRGRMAQSYRAKITTAVSCPVPFLLQSVSAGGISPFRIQLITHVIGH